MSQPAKIEKLLGYQFRNPSLLQGALTHPSALSEGISDHTNQRLEFLGDAVLELIVSEKLFRENPEAAEGRLTITRASLVRGPSLTELARQISLGDSLILGTTARQNQTHENQAALEDAVEAIFGAAYLDGGLDAARTILNKLFEDRSFDVDSFVPIDENPKGALQEFVQANPESERPTYEIVRIDGPPHDRIFESTVTIDGKVLAHGTGPSKKAAETEAARGALEKLRNS
ncbi:MAG: ribonuclease III [Puniceicoccales bacterium]